MYHGNLGLEAAVNRVVEMLHASYQRFYAAEKALFEESDSYDHEGLGVYLSCFKDIVMCNLHWR